MTFVVPLRSCTTYSYIRLYQTQEEVKETQNDPNLIESHNLIIEYCSIVRHH
jgi:hypothetical protein